jgi:hypothetical protein
MTENQNPNQSPSLLEAESTGGDNSSTGLDFQAYLILCRIPYWLSFEGFSSCIWESIGDIEAKFFHPEYGEVIEVIEAKNHDLSPKKFWEEIERFKKMDDGSPGTYRWFTLSCTGLSRELHPLVNGLRRIRDPYTFYDPSSGVIQNSYKEYKEKVISLEKDEQIAEFLFNKVLIEHKWGSLNEQAKGMFNTELLKHQPDYDLRSSEQEKVFTSLHNLVRSQKNKPVSRKQLKQTIYSVVDEATIPLKSVRIHTANTNFPKERKELNFLWASYFGGQERRFPPSSEWDAKISKLIKTQEWIRANRSTRNIHISGNRRISSSLAFGSVFSAVSGFVIDAEQRDGEVWTTNDYNNESIPEYQINKELEETSGGDELIVTIGITRDSIADEVSVHLYKQGLNNLPKLHLNSKTPIISAAQANLVASKLKREIKSALVKTKANKVHLFYAGPGHLALLLGHRWNGLPSLLCYEWVSTGQYVLTCTI